MRVAVLPFALAAENSVSFITRWQDVRHGKAQEVTETIPEWDHMAVLSLHAAIEVDVGAVLSSAHLGKRTGLAVEVSAGSSSTRMRGPVWMEKITSDQTHVLDIAIDLSGSEIGGRLDLITQVVVVQPDSEDQLSASLPGTIIWRHRQSVLLEGDASQFPTETADLSAPRYNVPQAGWLLHVADNLDLSAAAAIRLVVNETHPMMQQVLEGAETPMTVAALGVMRWDVARQLIELALDNDEFIERYDTFDEDTLGWLLAAILGAYFPGESPRAMRAGRDSDRSRFETRLQDHAKVLG